MSGSRTDKPADRTFAQLADAQDLRSVITAALAASPIYEQALRRGVWNYVSAERRAGMSPGRIIDTLTELVDAARVSPASVRTALTRQVILWCVEAYFGHLGGEVVVQQADALSVGAGGETFPG